MTLTAPFPWFGGKSRVANLVWSRFGSIGNYIEPFFGSGATLLQRPESFDGWVTVNDLDGNVANFWRAAQAAPAEVAAYACAPVNECDLHARHLWLVNNLPKMAPRLMADPNYFEARTAGWWAWGLCSWIGSGWCSGEGPWVAEPDESGVPVLTRHNGGQGVNRQLPHLGNGGQGVNRQLPHLGNGGKGVNRQLPHLGDGGRLEWLTEWCERLARALRDARITCGDWVRICSPGTMTRNGICGVLLDPPYSTDNAAGYAYDSSTVAKDVREWCVANGENPSLRIALCGHDGEHGELESIGWAVEAWGSNGYQGADSRERVWFSPHCLRPEVSVDRQVSLFPIGSSL